LVLEEVPLPLIIKVVTVIAQFYLPYLLPQQLETLLLQVVVAAGIGTVHLQAGQAALVVVGHLLRRLVLVFLGKGMRVVRQRQLQINSQLAVVVLVL